MFGVIDLNACYASRDDGHRERNWQESPYRFENDGHWNELGNRLAAACLDERLRREAGLPAMTEGGARRRPGGVLRCLREPLSRGAREGTPR